MNPVYVYVAGPMLRGDVVRNVGFGCGVAYQLMTIGYIPHVPQLTHFWEELAKKAGLDGRTGDEWLTYDEHWILKCDVVLRLPGYSPEADREVLYAQQHNIPVVYTVEELKARYPLTFKTSAQRDSRSGRQPFHPCSGVQEA